VRAGGFHPGDVGELIGEPAAAGYDERRMQIARAEVVRAGREFELPERFFEGRVVIDVGPGPLGFPDACPARVAIDPLAERYRTAGLLVPGGSGVHLATGGERLPLLGSSVAVALARNSLDHVRHPQAVVAELRRVLKPGATLLLNVDVDHPASATEPHGLAERDVERFLSGFEIELRRLHDHAHGGGGRMMVVRARRV
jgi:SAM-dependent methyltransferase